jgi:two-component sensor histidine kinase
MGVATMTASLPDERLLIRELTHRISNEFTCAANMIALAIARARDREARAALTTAMERLEDYARLHRAMRVPEIEIGDDASPYLHELCLAISRAKLQRKNIDLIFIECPLSLHAEQCWLLGMILYELITYAACHAFGANGGEIRVEIAQGGGRVECRVLDDGRGPIASRHGQGSPIVEELAASLGGACGRRSGPCGSACIVIFPAD